MLDRLRHPGGILAFIGLTLAGAAVLALGALTQRSWFEGKVRQKFAPVTAQTAALGAKLGDAEADKPKVTALGDPVKAELYQAWLTTGQDWPAAAPAVMFAADAPFYLRCAQETLICGGPDQRRAAARFLGATGSPAARPLVEWAITRADQLHDDATTQALTGALAQLISAAQAASQNNKP